MAQLVLCKLLEEPGCVITVARKTLPALKATAMKDFFTILKDNGIYNEKNHNKSEHTYHLNGSEVEFISVDQPQKVRGRKRDYLWLNETNEFSLEDFKQLSIRTIKQIYFDYNPSDVNSWIYDHIFTRKDILHIHSTYKDNPFLEQEIIKEIENYKDTDENFWRIYGLGLRGISDTKIYNNWQFCDTFPEGDTIYGLDFGFNHPTALIEVAERDNTFYFKERAYVRFMTNDTFIKLLDELKIDKKRPIYADSEDAQRIAEIKKAGYWVIPANKEGGSVKAGIDYIKRSKVFITKDSVNLHKESKMYSWKKRDDVILDEPVKIDDDAMDAVRYAIYSHYVKSRPIIGIC